MRMPSRLGRYPVLLSLAGGLLVVSVSALAVGWYALGEEQRTGRLLSRLLSRQLGSPVRVERAGAEPSRLTLRGITLPAGKHWGGTVEIRELRVEGSVLPVAAATSVTLAAEAAPRGATAPDALSAIRRGVLRFLEWPAVVSLEMTGGELRSGDATLAFDLKGEKSADGKLKVQLDFHPTESSTAFSVEAVGTAVGQDVQVELRAEGEPRRLGAAWPSVLPSLSGLTAHVGLVLSASATLDVTGQVTATPTGEKTPEPLTTRFRARYGARAQRVDLSRLSLEWGPALRLDLTGSAEELDRSPRLTIEVNGMAGPIGVVTAKSPLRSAEGARLWPLAVEARIPDLSRLPRLTVLPLALSGEAQARGAFEWSESAASFTGQLTAHVREGALNVGSPLMISDLRISLPLTWGREVGPPAGTMTAESLTAFGFVLHRLASPAHLKGSTLALPEITYLHYGGSGKGYAEVELAGAAELLRLRVEGQDVDLAKLTTEYGLTVGRITGKIGYVLALQYSRARGLLAGGQVTSKPPGGQVNIDALKKLLSAAEADPMGILKQTLENLSAFSYRSLSADVRVGPRGGRINLSLKGKKWLGLFPGRVRAINLQNVPLSILVKTFGQSRRDSP